MATITTEFGKVDTKKQRAVYLRLRDKTAPEWLFA